MQCSYFLHFFLQTLDYIWKTVWFSVGWKPGLQIHARSLFEALQQEEASVSFSLCGKKHRNLIGTKCLVGPCVSTGIRSAGSAESPVQIFMSQRMQRIPADEPKARRVQDLEGASAVRVPCAKHRGHSSNMHSRHKPPPPLKGLELRDFVGNYILFHDLYGITGWLPCRLKQIKWVSHQCCYIEGSSAVFLKVFLVIRCRALPFKQFDILIYYDCY